MLAYRIVSSFYLMKKNKEKYVSEREVIKSMRIQAFFYYFHIINITLCNFHFSPIRVYTNPNPSSS